jgi:cyclophilin family peptidyl-prolyl cis-trans isomerase
MATETSPTPSAPPAARKPLPTALPGRAKLWIGVLAVAAVGLVAWLLFKAADEEQRLEQWDVYGQIREENEWEELFFDGSAPIYQAARDKYVRQLEAFIATLDASHKDALEPQARWRIVLTEGDSLLSMKDVLDVAKRLPHTERAIAQLQVLEKDFPSFPLNWGKEFAPPGFASTTRRLVDWFKKNAEWEREHLPRDKTPDATTTIVFRTDRGDMRMGLHVTDAPAATARLVAAVRNGLYDGTALVERVEDSVGGEMRIRGVRGGDARVGDAKPFEPEAALAWAKVDAREGLLPDESRNRVLHTRGTVTSWHPEGDVYDHPTMLIFVTHASPGLDYANTPVGKLLDTASLETLDRVFGAVVWREDPVVEKDSGDLRSIVSLYQAPARIVKALAYKDGTLLAPEGTPAPTRVAPDASEQTLAGLKPDAYKVEPPAPPAPKGPELPPSTPTEPK